MGYKKREPVNKICFVCFRTFIGRDTHRSFMCSKNCSKLWKAMGAKLWRESNYLRSLLNCKVCGKGFLAGGNRKCCSEKCSEKNMENWRKSKSGIECNRKSSREWWRRQNIPGYK